MADQAMPVLETSYNTLERSPLQQVMAIASPDEDDSFEDDEEDDSWDSESLLLDLIDDDDKTEFASVISK